MKKLICYYCSLLIFMIISLLFLSRAEQRMQQNNALRQAKYSIELYNAMEDVCYFDFLETIIPQSCNQFIQPFYEHTKNDKTIGIELLAIAWNESQWRLFRSPKNKNGTRDYGPLMLNSIHLQTPWFKHIKEQYEDVDVAYMVGGIQIYKDLRTRHNAWDSFRMYNGGERGGLRKTATLVYAENANKYFNTYNEAWHSFKKEPKKVLQNVQIQPRKISMQNTPLQSLQTYKYKYTIIPYIKKIRLRILSRRLYYMA